MKSNLLKELQEKLPANAGITEIKFEGSEIILYTKSREFFKDGEETIKQLVGDLKKRIELRPDLGISMDMEKAKKTIEEMIPQDAGVKAVYFEPELGKVIIEAQKPGIVIGKGGETFKRIRNETFWLPKIERAPAIESDIVRAVRNFLHTEIDYRKKFLNNVGQKINTEIDMPLEKQNEWIRVSMLGGFRQVGRSALLLQTQHSNVLLDCGVEPGSEETPYFNVPEFNIDNLDAVVLSHAHIDHAAYIPWLYKQGYKGPLYCNAPTRDLMVLLCLDYIDVCQKNGKNVPYNKKDIERAVKHSITLDYGEVSDITPNMRLTLQPSGHLLGSSLTHLHIGEGVHNILYTSDMKFAQTRLFEPAWNQFQRVETLIIESTYAGRDENMPPRQVVEEEFMGMINKTMECGGKVLIPSFAVGRSQELMVILANNNFQYPVYMEGMVWDATAIHTAYPEFLSKRIQSDIFRYGNNPFLYEKFHHTVPKERDSIMDSAEPCVIIATSGMLIGGPSVEYFKAMAPNKKDMLMFVGWQSPASLGSRIQKGWKEIPAYTEDGKTRTQRVEMKIQTVHGLSGHAGHNELMNYIYKLTSRPERVIVGHGEPKKCVEFAREVGSRFRCEALAPKNLETIRVK